MQIKEKATAEGVCVINKQIYGEMYLNFSLIDLLIIINEFEV